jgi:hypothetical protein
VLLGSVRVPAEKLGAELAVPLKLTETLLPGVEVE